MISKWAKRFVVAAAVMAPAMAGADRYGLPTRAVAAREIYDLHTLIFVICCAVFVAVFGAMIYSIIRHRRAARGQAQPFHQNVMVEIAWTIVPFFILIGMTYPATKTVILMTGTAGYYSSLAPSLDGIDHDSDEESRSAVNGKYPHVIEQYGSNAEPQEASRHHPSPAGSSVIPRSAS